MACHVAAHQMIQVQNGLQSKLLGLALPVALDGWYGQLP